MKHAVRTEVVYANYPEKGRSSPPAPDHTGGRAGVEKTMSQKKKCRKCGVPLEGFLYHLIALRYSKNKKSV